MGPAPAALSPRLRAQVLQREYVPSIYFSEVIHVATPGTLSADFAGLPLTKRDPSYWPRVENPFA